jgi:PERQ amino acid-rich with GYF domain-containing protein
MVMPDRMRWIYRDPQGNMQGPWTGLEMHDWFKAGFFTAELQVKKVEDAEYEPLAQLVRRIGNSREPFLVPQIGIPHGPAPNQSGSWAGSAGSGAGGTTSHPGTAQPPFPSSFPSFGTTLTAEQQNALERRKQEEQYLMARQKEHLAQQQALMKQMHLQGGTHPMHPHQLQHHSSAHSLHSQPSYGSITSPAGYQPPPIQGPIQPPQSVTGFFEPPMRQNTLPNLGPQMLAPDLVNREDELPTLLDRLNVNRTAQLPFNTGPSFGARQQENAAHSPQVAAMLQDRARLQQEQEQYDLKSQADPIFDQQARDERLRQFHSLRRQMDDEVTVRRVDGLPTHPTTVSTSDEPRLPVQEDVSSSARPSQQGEGLPSGNGAALSLSQQVQKAASAQRQQQQTQSPVVQTESPWAKVESGMPQPFPPPSSSPLPAPAAQRNRQNVADTLAAGSRSQSQTPIETPTTSVAPWAKDSNEGPKGPSLKEIQEAEARKAAKLEEIASAARRALAEQERANPPPAPTPGLPSSANWASAGSPVTPNSSATSVWAKTLAGKSLVNPATGVPKKTLAQIQKEEEARKQRLAVSNAAQAAASYPAAASAGKRYADLAGKIALQTTLSGTWTTVGAGGKPKPPPAAPAGPRSIGGGVPVAPVAKARPVAVTRTSSIGTSTASNPNKATEELTKWAKIALGKGLNSSINGKINLLIHSHPPAAVVGTMG